MENFLQALVCRSAPLAERLAGIYLPGAGISADTQDELWRRWSAALSRDDSNALSERLKLAGISPGTARSVIGPLEPREGAPLPAWTRIVERVVSREHTGDDSPFRPWIETARELLQKRAEGLLERLSPRALEDLEKALRGRLNIVAGKSWEVETAVRQAVGAPLDERQFLRDYPGAARLMGLAVEFWVEAAAEFLQRLKADQAELRRLFGSAASARVEAIQASLSDPHCCGRAVWIATFSESFKLVCKPRSLGLEAAWFDFTRWLNERGCPITWKVARVLDCGNYGWMEYIPHEPCMSEAEVEGYFERAGATLALLHALAGSDMHMENLIACGPHPVPIDLEVLMMAHRGNPHHDEQDGALHDAARLMRHSVLSIGMLPTWMSMGKGKVFNVGGLGAKESAFGGPVRNQAAPHQAVFNGAPVSSHLHRPAILRGFRLLYEFLLQNRDGVLAPNGPLERFRGEPSRFVNRPTAVYFRALRRAAAPPVLSCGTTRSLEFEVFLKSVLHAPMEVQEEVLAVTAAEMLALEQGDIPFFQGRVDSRDLPVPGTDIILKDFFAEDGFFISRERIRNLSREDLEVQSKLIGLSFDLMGNGAETVKTKPPVVAFPARSFRDEALAIAEAIRGEAIRSGGDATWIAPQMISGTEHFSLQLAGNSLYDGLLGVMLFLFAMEARLDDKPSGVLAREVFASFQRTLRKSAHLAVLRQDALGLHGLGGRIHALLTCAKLSGNSDILTAALEIGDMITEAAIAKEKQFDILYGHAGAIPPLLALHSETADAQWLQKAVACGERLLAGREVAGEDRRSWKANGKFLAGYSHGAAGCAASLLRLHAVCGEERFREAAREAIDYENTLYVPEAGNWRDLRVEGSFMASWCHGSPGILLGRLFGDVPGEIRQALASTIASGLSPVDQCCCGNAGKADILLTASEKLNDSTVAGQARALMEQTISEAHANGGYRCYGKLPRTVRGPGFFQGVAGIGYTLLRMEGGLPSVLAME